MQKRKIKPQRKTIQYTTKIVSTNTKNQQHLEQSEEEQKSANDGKSTMERRPEQHFQTVKMNETTEC